MAARQPKSAGEEEFLSQILAAGLPAPVREFKFARGLGFDVRADFAWGSPHNLLWEISGGVWKKGAHSSGTGITRDHWKTSMAAALGYRVGMSTTDQVFDKSGLYWLACALGIHDPKAADVANSLPAPEPPRRPKRRARKAPRKAWKNVMRRVLG